MSHLRARDTINARMLKLYEEMEINWILTSRTLKIVNKIDTVHNLRLS